MELFMKAKGSIVNLFHAELVLCIPRSVSTNPRQKVTGGAYPRVREFPRGYGESINITQSGTG
jgi:hypothetical protein